MDNSFKLGKLFGIEFRIHYTWFIIFVLITLSLSMQIFPSSYPGWSPVLYLVIGVIASLLFFSSVLAHELAHSLVGRVNGIPVSSITLFLFGGVSLMTREATRAKAEFLMAAAGPACSLMLSGLFALLWLLTRSIVEPLAAMVVWLAYVNLVLAVFNLIPGFPLDGGRVFRSISWRITGNYQRSTQLATRLGKGIGYLFIGLGILNIFWSPFGWDWISGLWLAFIGWFLVNAASASYRQLQWRETARKFTAHQVMATDCPVIPPDITVAQLLQRYLVDRRHRCFLVANGGKLEGVLFFNPGKASSRTAWETTRVAELMIPRDRLKVASPDQDAQSILDEMDESGTHLMPVASGDVIIGLVIRENILRLVQNHTR